jgi:hypothetical protein
MIKYCGVQSVSMNGIRTNSMNLVEEPVDLRVFFGTVSSLFSLLLHIQVLIYMDHVPGSNC